MDSFDVLDLLPKFFHCSFSCDYEMGEAGVIGLAADGVEFAVEFLTEEIQWAARGFRPAQGESTLVEVAGEP